MHSEAHISIATIPALILNDHSPLAPLHCSIQCKVYSCYSHNTINNKPPATKRLALDGSRYTRGNAGTHFSKRRKSRPPGRSKQGTDSFQMQTEHAPRTMGVPR